MTGGSHRARRAVALAVVVPVLAAGLLASVPARAQSTADIQWAQTILKDKGYNIGGRANGQMHPETKAALGKYQAAHGLPVTNQLDKATIAKMMGEREGKAPPTVGNLAQQKVGGGGPGQAPREPQREVVPRAAPTQRIDSGAGSVGGGAQFSAGPPATASHSSGSHSSGAPSSAPAPSAPAPSAAASSQGPVPQAAPRASVTATTPSGQPVPVVEPAAGSGSMMPGWATNGVRYGVMGVIGTTVLGIGFAWWRSGRAGAPKPAPRDDGPRDQRREPSFGGARRREELTTGALPPLTSGGRGRR
ncbi:peptidoglycan-binding domain-containing protein [Roseomonas genomospecies 6]|uniref:Peptidoglycan-binding protein n=1 Tax=Roseomonas genomospecies 6 TaxID=214106 RepID=A0A9W7TY47_9PROT|nr:peptidoglycan-binding domain-containing protein [Roseomonas genomospecies 6]KAA0679222.1 peptidoglycan-binding protein [Roseomonas genomospecies 6]